jgi:hypothetical protein
MIHLLGSALFETVPISEERLPRREGVKVIFDTSDLERSHRVFAGYAANESPDPGFDIRSYPGFSILR